MGNNQSGLQLRPDAADRQNFLDDFTRRIQEPGYISSLLEPSPSPPGRSGSTDSSKSYVVTGDSGVEYLLSPQAAHALSEDVKLGVSSISAGLLPATAGDARARAFLERMFKNVSGSYTAGATFTGRLERRLAATSSLLGFLQVWGPYGQLPQAPTPPPPAAADGSIDAFAPFQPVAVLGRPISDFQDDIVAVDLLSRLLTIGRSRSLEDITACATECNAALSSVPVLSWFRHWSFKPESESSVIMLELSKAVASSSVGMCVPANAVQTRKWWQSGPSPAESTWRCPFRGGQRKHVSRVLFRAHDTMRPKTVHIRGSTDGTLFTDLCRPRPVAFAGDIVIDLTSASRPLAISHIEIVLIGCQGNGASACHSIENLEVYTAPPVVASREPVASQVINATEQCYGIVQRLLAGEFGQSDASSAATLRCCTALLQLAAVSGSVVPFVRASTALIASREAAFVKLTGPAADELLYLLYRVRVEVEEWRSELEEAEVADITGVHPRDEGNPAVFDQSCSDGVAVQADGRTVVSSTSDCFAVVNYPMTEGEFTWSFNFEHDKSGDEFTCFGVTSLPVDAAKYDVNKCMWVVRCFNGTRYKHGKEVRGNVPAIHPGVILHFRLNLTTHTLTMAVGDAPAVTLFTDVTGTVHPVVSFYHDNARISVHEPVKCVSADLTAPPRRVVGQFGKYSLLDVISEKPRKRRVEDPLAAAAVPAVVRPKPVVAAPRPPPVPTRWNCGVCTFSNGPSASTCEMCSTAKPAEGAAAASARKWSCGACTFENEPAEAKCTLCGTDRPASTIGIDEPVDAAADESLQIAAAIAAATEAAAAAEAERAKLDAAFTLFKSRPVSAMVADVLGLLAAVAQIQERRFDAAQSRRGDSCRLLAIPLAVHVTPAAFAALAQLVAATAALPVRTDGPSLGADMDVAETALRIAGSHCRRLQATGISLTLLGLSLAPDSGVSALKTALFDMAQSSLPLTDAKRLAVAVQACAVIDDGVALLLPREEERVALVTALLAENAATPFSPQAPKYALLSMLMKKCSREPLLASLIPAWDPLPSLEVLGNGTRCLKLLTDSMLRDDLVSLTAARSGEPAGGGPRLTAHVSSVVVVHARHVFVGVANAIESFSRKSVAERATAPLQSHPALVSLTALWTAVLSNALQVLDAARDILLRDATRASSVEAVLLSSQIAGLLPFVGTVLCLFDKQLAVVEIVLPGLIALIRAVDGVNRLLPAVVLAEKASRFEEMEQHSLEAGSLSRGELDHATAIRDSGLTSAKLHALLDLERTLVSAAARMSAAMVAGTPEEEEEEFLSPWLKSCVLKAGVDVVDALLQGGGAVDDVELLSARAAAGSTFAPGAWPLRPVMSDAVQKLSGNAHGDATAPLDWEVAMTAVYDPAAASRAQRLSQACLADWRRSKACEPYHRARSAFFEQLLSSTPVRDSGETCGALLTQWLHAKAKISPIQRKHGKTAFLDCEIVVLAVYLRHTGLWRDADVVLQALIRGEEVAVIPETLNQIWKRVFNVRRWLTMQKSMFEQGNWVPVGVFASDTDAEAVVEPVPAAPPAPIGGAGGVEESKSGDVPAASRARPTIRRRKKLSPEPCESFEAFKATVISRALFLLSTACALGDPDEEWGALADVDTSGGHTGQLQGKWSGLLAAPTLGPLLTRWKSSLDLDAVDPSDLDLGLDVPAAGSDAPSAPAAAMPPPPDSSEHVTGLEKIKVACGPAQQFLYTGQAAHPDVLRALFARRRVRACQRLYGLKAQNALLGAVSLSSATLDALMFLKPAFRGRIRFVEDLISEGRDVSAVVPDVASIRHHYLKALEGAPSPLQDLVQAAFIALFTRLSEVLASAASEGDLALGRAAMWNWALDFEDRDHEFLLRVGLLPALYRMASFERHAEYFPRVRELPSSEWFIWPAEFVVTGLRAGTLSVKDVVTHVTTAPAGVLSPAWLSARGLGGSVEEAARQHSVASIIAVHADMLRELAADGSPVLNEAAQARDLSRRVMNCRLLAPDAAATATIAGGSPVHQGSVVNRLVEVDGLAVEFRQCAQGLLHLLCALSLGLHHTTSDTRGAPTKDASDKADAPDADAGEDDEMLERRQSARYVLSTRKQVRGLLEAELAFAAEVLVHDATKRVTGGAGDAVSGFIDAFGQSTQEVLKAVEEAAYNTLVFLSAIHACTGRSTSDWDSNMLTSLVDLTLVGSPRIQQLALRVMRDALPHVQPNRVNAIVLAAVQRTLPLFMWPGGVSVKGEDGPQAPSSFAELLLHKIACTLCVTPAGSTESGGSLCQPIGTGAGYAAQCTAAEASSLARHLLLTPGSAWCSAIADAVNRALLSASPFVAGPALTDDSAKSERCRRAMASAAAALCLMGADADVLRTGGRFAMANSVQAARAAATASAAVDSSRERPSEASADGAASPEASEAARSIANKALMGVLQLQAPEGVVLAYRFGALRADVVFFSDVEGRSISSTQSLLVSTIVPAAEVVVRPAAIPLTPDLLRMLLAVCQLDLGVSADASRRKHPVAAVGGAAGGPTPVEVWSVWRSQLKSRAMQALQVLLQDAGCSAAALSAGLFPHLLRAALVPVPMPQFVALRWLQFRANVLRERLLDAASGVIIGQEVAAGGDGPVLSAEEVKRHAQADELVSMGLGKKDLCVTALLLNRDIMDRAVEWLLGREAEAFVEGGGLDKSLGEANPRWGAARDLGLVVAMHPKLCYHALELSGDDRNAATTWLMEHGLGYAKSEWIVGSEREATTTATVSRAHVCSDEAIVDDVGTTGPLMAAVDDSDRASESADAAESLVSEGSRGAPEAQLELATGAARTSLKPCSMVLHSTKLGEVMQLGTSGVLCALVPRSITAATVSLRTVSPYTGVATVHSQVSWDSIRCITAAYSQPLTDVSVIRMLSALTESAVATHAARRAVMSLLLAWPASVPCTLEAVGGPVALLSLAKVVAASENIFSRDATLAGGASSSPLMDLVKNRLKGFLVLEKDGRGLAGKPLSSALVGDCTRNIEDSTRPGDASEAIVHESLHPHFPKCEYIGEVTFEGAKALSITFHPRSGLSAASLTIMKDKRGVNAVARFSTPDTFKPIVVHGDKLFYKFRADSDGSTQAWGYRFDVSPMRGLQWLNEREALSDPSLMWACWLLRFLLDEVKQLVPPAAVRSRTVFDSLLRYVTTTGAPFKHQVVSLLTQLLSSPELFARDALPDFGRFVSLERVVLAAIESHRASGSVFLPWKLQQLVEMCAMARFSMRCCNESRPARQAFDAARDIVVPSRIAFLSSPKLRVPVVRPAVLNLLTDNPVAAMVDLMDMSECLVLNARLPDRFTAAIGAIAAGLEPEDPKQLKLDDVVIMNSKWSPQQDDQLVRWIFTLATSRSKAMADLTVSELSSGVTSAVSNFALKDFNVDELVCRFATVKLFNLLLIRCIDLVDMTNTSDSWVLGSKLRQLGHLIFADTKNRLVEAAVEKSWVESECGLSAVLDNQAAFQSMEAGRADPSTSNCLFIQGFSKLGHGTGDQFRCRLDSRGRLFGVSFAGEDGLDWGGLYRDAITLMVEDCFSARLNLCLVCPNGANQQGTNMDKYLPNPKHASPRILKMFEFMGKLIGVSMRQKLYLPFAFPSIVWKQLVGEPVTLDDVCQVDEACAVQLTDMKDMARLGSRADFESKYGAAVFVISGSDGQSVELLPGGATLRVTWDTRDQFVRLAESFKIHEFDAQVSSMRAGLVDVIPERALKMCTWQELEVLVCGDPHIDVEVMRANTTYQGFGGESDRACQYFWRVMRSLPDVQRSEFVRFAWGRSRLPKGKWERPFKLTKKSGGDNQLPIAHTCFFQIELPEYSTEDIMRKRIIAACTYGIGGFLIA